MQIIISEIYKKYNIPSNLQDHMLRAAAFAELLSENWRGTPINLQDIMTTMLIHDIGNIAKMDFTNYNDSNEEKDSRVYWETIKKKFIRKYGADDHIATFNIASELELNPRILWLVINKIFVHNEMIANLNDYDLKICAYSDQRTGPNGIVSLKDRFEELKKRYGKKPNASINHPRSGYLIESALKIEKQILKNTSIGSADILNEKISERKNNLLKYEIQTTNEKSI